MQIIAPKNIIYDNDMRFWVLGVQLALNKIVVLLIHRKAINIRHDDELYVVMGSFVVFLFPCHMFYSSLFWV